jgi:phosphoribosylanthranilate isomerase
MRTRIKICGITRDEDARAAAAAGADAIGFVMWSESPRYVAPAIVAGIARDVPGVARVGVFVNAAPEVVARTVREAGLTAVQLHGDETVAEYRGCGAPVIKAVTLEAEDDVGRAAELPADVTVLVDASDPVRRGGTGRIVSWSLAAELARRRPVLLAGGLSPANVAEAIDRVHPWGVDVSSGVEHAPGVKDAVAIRELCLRVAAVDGRLS